MEDLILLSAGVVIAFLMTYLKKGVAWLRRQHDIVKALVVFVIAAGVMYGGKLLGVTEIGEFPKAGLVAMAVNALYGSLKNVFAEPEEEKAARLAQ